VELQLGRAFQQGTGERGWVGGLLAGVPAGGGPGHGFTCMLAEMSDDPRAGASDVLRQGLDVLIVGASRTAKCNRAATESGK